MVRSCGSLRVSANFLVLLTMTSSVLAQTTDTDSTASQRAGNALTEIVVTAQRREESLERTPVAVDVLSADALDKGQITTEQDLQTAIPGLNVRAGISANQLNYAIRGQSLDQFSDGAPGVLPYINEVQINGAGDGGATAFYDLQSVQLLKGPQGTLFGRSAVGGAVLFTTQKPKDDFEGYVSLTRGNYDNYIAEGALNAPLVKDVLLARLAFFYQSRDGYQYNIYDDRNIGGLEREGVRLSLTGKFGDFVTNDLVMDYNKLNSSNEVAVLYNLGLPYNPANPSAQVGGIIPAFNVSTYYGPGGIGVVPRTPPNAGAPLVPCDKPFAGGYNPVCGDFVQNLASQYARGPYVVDINGPDYYDDRSALVTNTTEAKINANTTIKNIIGYQHTNTEGATDQDGTGYTIARDIAYYRADDFSDEIQLSGDTLQDKLKYVVGVYGSSDYKYAYQPLYTYLSIFGPASATANYTKEDKLYAAYAQGTYDLSQATSVEGLGVTLGVRHTYDTPSISVDSQSQFIGICGHAGVGCAQSKTVENTGWTIGLQDQLNQNLLVYLTSRRSYKDAGYNAFVAPFVGTGSGTGGPGGDGSAASAKGNGFNTETVTDIELGLKFAGSFLSMPSHLNVAAYNNWVTDSQRTAYGLVGGALAAFTVNVPKAAVSGLELDTVISPLEWLNVGGSANFTDARFTNGLVNGVVFTTYPDTPRWSGDVFAEIVVPVTASINASLRGDYYGQSHIYGISNANLNLGAVLPGYQLGNLRFTVEDKKAGWSVIGNIKNIANEIYYVGGEDVALLEGWNTAVPGLPRTYTIEARYSF